MIFCKAHWLVKKVPNLSNLENWAAFKGENKLKYTKQRLRCPGNRTEKPTCQQCPGKEEKERQDRKRNQRSNDCILSNGATINKHINKQNHRSLTEMFCSYSKIIPKCIGKGSEGS